MSTTAAEVVTPAATDADELAEHAQIRRVSTRVRDTDTSALSGRQ